jgi:glycosyltransferase involved in cell wall biosynthesis
MRQINWNVVNDLIFVAPQCERKFNTWVIKSSPMRTHVIPNGYNSGLFNIPQEKQYEKRMVMAGNIYWKKGHYEMIEAMSTIPEWKLHIIGDPGRQQGYEYWVNCLDCVTNRGLEGRIMHEAKMPREELMERFAQASVIISASLEEGTHCVIAEGMLAGLYPLVRHWDGAEEMYPPECIWNNFDELRDKLKEWEGFSLKEKRKASMHFRLWVEKRYDYEGQARKIADVIEDAASDKPESPWWQQ